MQRDREIRENPFGSFGGSGFPGSTLPSMFGGKDPFDDPFFSRPYGNMSRSDMFGSDQLQQTRKSKGPVIEELDSDAEEVPEEGGDGVHGTAWSNRNPLVEHPEDQVKDDGKSTNNRKEVSSTARDKGEGTRAQSHSVSFQRVTYGGINGTYYSAKTSRQMGSDGVTLEESKQADRTTGQATHRVSRGIHDKGHSVTRKLGSDGKVDTVQTLHNLHEDELAGFEQAWGDRRGHGWDDTFGFPSFSGSGSSIVGQLAQGGFPDPSLNRNIQGQSNRGRTKKVVTINIE